MLFANHNPMERKDWSVIKYVRFHRDMFVQRRYDRIFNKQDCTKEEFQKRLVVLATIWEGR